MGNVASLKTVTSHEADEWQLRVDLAAAFRLAAHYNWHEAVANHLSLAVSPDGKNFLMNPRWRHFSRIKASELLLLDSTDSETMNRPDAPDLTAWCAPWQAACGAAPGALHHPSSPDLCARRWPR